MNNLKFRFWDHECKDWRELPDLYGDYQAHAFRTYGDGFEIRHFLNSEAQDKIKSGLLEINQWTGLQDKNRRDIYQGDYLSFEIPKITHGPEKEFITNAEVWYDAEYAMWCFGKFINKNCSPPHEWSYDLSWPLDKKTLLVTGNIYEKNLTI